MKIKTQKLQEIFDDKNEIINFLLESFDDTNIEFDIDSKPNEKDKKNLKILNETCKELQEIFKNADLKISLKDIKKLIEERKLQEEEYPNKNSENNK